MLNLTNIFCYDYNIDVTTRSIETGSYRKKVIKEEEIKNFKDLSELINKVSINFSKTQPGALGSVWINGVKTTDSDIYSSSGVLILINGHPVNSLIDNIPSEGIEKIEIIEGPFSSSYGSGAIGGIINIITKKKDDNKIGIDISYGSFDYLKAGFFAGFNKELSIMTAGSHEERKDYNTPEGRYINTDYKKNNGYFGFLTPIGNSILEGSFIYFKGDNIGTPFKISMNDPDDYVNILNIVSDIKLTTNINDNILTNQIYFTYNKRSNYGIDTLWPYESHTKIKTLGYQPGLYIFTDIFNISCGIDISYSTISKKNENGNYNQPDVSNINFGSFVEINKKITESLKILLGGRYDLYSMKIEESKGITFIGSIKDKKFDYFSVRGGLNYEFYEKTLIKINGGTGFRAPSILERYGTYTGPWGNYEGNPELKPETSLGISSTIGYYSKNIMYITLDYIEIKDRISTYYNSSTFTTSYYNQKKAYISNIKAGIEYNFAITDSLDIKIETEGVYNIKGEDENNNHILYLPEYKIIANLYLISTYFTFNIINNYTGKVYDTGDKNIGEYNVLDLSLTIPFNISGKDIKIKSKVNNVTNKYYQFVDGFPMPGRNYEIGIEYSMKI